MPQSPFIRAKRHAERAIARGDLDAAVRWTRIMCDHINAARTMLDLFVHAAKQKPKLIQMTPALRAKIEATAKQAPPTMPVMLDPDGFSPGGTPNWFLNHQRLERAGLPISLAPQTRTERKRANPTGP